VPVIRLLPLDFFRAKPVIPGRGVCKKTTGPHRRVGQWWVGPKGGIAGVSLSIPLQTTGQHSGVQLFNSQSFDPNLS